MASQKQAVAGIGRIPSGGGAIGERGIGDCGGGAIELLPVEEGEGEKRTSDPVHMSDGRGAPDD